MYPKSIRYETRFPCIGSRAMPHSTSYTKSGLTSFRQLQRFPETPVSSLEEHQFQNKSREKLISAQQFEEAPYTPNHVEMKADSLTSTEKVCQLSTSTSSGGFPQHYICERDAEVAVSSEWTPRCPDSRDGRIFLQGFDCRLIFHLTRCRDFYIPCGHPRESPTSPPHLDRRPHIPLIHREASAVQCFKR